MAERIEVEVALDSVDGCALRRIVLDAGATVGEALRAAGIAQTGDAAEPPVGVFGHRVALDRVLHDGDRVEIYRPLVIDPKDARRRRARGS